MSQFLLILVTCGSRREATKIARALVDRRVAACVNVISAPVESIYRWKGRRESAKEFLLVIKTSRRRFAALQREVTRLHSYEVPEIIAVPISGGSRKYLRWLGESVGGYSQR
jgi:periplasmic divalent cation tolerance protein